MKMDEVAKIIPEEHRGALVELNNLVEKSLAGKLSINEHDGKKFLPIFFPETAKYAREEWDGIRENDVFLASFPKTGTNWCLTVLYKIVTAGNPKLFETIEKIPLHLLALEVGATSRFAVLDSLPLPRRVIVTHLDGEDFPMHKATAKGAKIIYILRNPKDQTVSWYHFAKKLKPLQNYRDTYPEDWEKFTQLYFAGKHALFTRDGDWYPEHILSWYKHKHQDNVKFVYYEDLKKDLKSVIKDLAEYLGVKLNNEQVVEIAKSCGFEAMKSVVETKQGGIHNVRKTLNLMRKGQVGGWKDYFTVSQSEAIDAEFKQKLANTDINFTYEL